MDSHTSSQTPKPELHEQGINVPILAVTLAMAVPILAAIVILTNAAYRYAWANEEERKVIDAPHKAVDPVSGQRVDQLITEQLANLGAGSAAESAYRWRDREAGTVVIPIDRAMELTIRDLHEN
ncbi:MAG: hypothetical protein RLN76_04205 [Phycisphaeraceae bacterium]